VDKAALEDGHGSTVLPISLVRLFAKLNCRCGFVHQPNMQAEEQRQQNAHHHRKGHAEHHQKPTDEGRLLRECLCNVSDIVVEIKTQASNE